MLDGSRDFGRIKVFFFVLGLAKFFYTDISIDVELFNDGEIKKWKQKIQMKFVRRSETDEHIEKTLREAGFRDINIQPRDESRESISQWFPGQNIENYVASAIIEARKP